MAAKYLRRNTWWVRFYHPGTGALLRGSLETQDAARAELLRQRVELEAALLEPRFRAADLPAAVRELVAVPDRMAPPVALVEPPPAPVVPAEVPVPLRYARPLTAPVQPSLPALLDAHMVPYDDEKRLIPVVETAAGGAGSAA
jgi:hypothetical protein